MFQKRRSEKDVSSLLHPGCVLWGFYEARQLEQIRLTACVFQRINFTACLFMVQTLDSWQSKVTLKL